MQHILVFKSRWVRFSLPPLQRLQLLQRPRPILPQQPRQTPIRQHPPARLASRAVIRLVVRVPNALNFLPASRTSQSIPPMHRHVPAKRSYLLRKTIPRLAAQPVRPQRERIAGSVKQPRPLLLLELVRERHRRKLRCMRNLIRVRVANSADNSRIGQRSFQRAIFLAQRRSKCRQIAREHVNSSRIDRAQTLFTRHHMQRSPPLRPRFRQHQRPHSQNRKPPDSASPRAAPPPHASANAPQSSGATPATNHPLPPSRFACQFAQAPAPHAPLRQQSAAPQFATKMRWPAARAQAAAR